MITDTQIASLRLRFRPPESVCSHEGGCERCIIWILLEHIAALQILSNAFREEARRAKNLARG